MKIEYYQEQKKALRDQACEELMIFLRDWFKSHPNLRLVGGNATWLLEVNYKDTGKWVTVDERGGKFCYSDMESDDLDPIYITHEWRMIEDLLLDWSCENVYPFGEINHDI
jgi:hypothetical protein